MSHSERDTPRTRACRPTAVSRWELAVGLGSGSSALVVSRSEPLPTRCARSAAVPCWAARRDCDAQSHGWVRKPPGPDTLIMEDAGFR